MPLVTALVVLVLMLAGCEYFFGPDTSNDRSLPAEVQNFITLMNDHRTSQGLDPLT